MSNTIEGSHFTPAQLETNECAETPKPVVPQQVNRLEVARQEERDYARSNTGSLSASAREYFAQIPTPGAAEVELSGLVAHNGGKVSAIITRDEQGEFTIKLNAQGRVGLEAGAGASVGVGAGTTWQVRTAEAAGDLLASMGMMTQPMGSEARQRVQHYAVEGLRQVEISDLASAGLHLPLPGIGGGLELTGGQKMVIDLDRNSLVIEQGLTGEAAARYGLLLFGGGLSGEVTAKQRTELRLPPEVIERLQNGKASVLDVLRDFKFEQKLVLEAEGRAEMMLGIADGGSHSRVKKYEAEIDANAFARNLNNPEGLKNAVHGKEITMISTDVHGASLEMMGSFLRARAVQYQVTEQPLFHGHAASGQELQNQLSSGMLKSQLH